MIKKIILAAALLLPGAAMAQQMSDITLAILEAYQKTLDENPEDFDTYYQRAVAYYQLSQYDKALQDLKAAIKHTPSKNADMLTREYSLRADVYQQMGDLNQALTAVDKALTISPKSYADLYKKGNLLLELGRNEEALASYRQMLSVKTHSQEGFFGMAQAEARMGNKAKAEEYMREARKSDQTSPLTYARLGDVYRDLDDKSTAVVSYLSCITMGGDMARPVGEIVKIAETDYNAYRQGMQYALEQTKESPMLTYIDARISAQAGAYKDAEKSLLKVMAQPDGRDASNLTEMARINLALGELNSALTFIKEALQIEPSSERNILKSQIELAAGNASESLLSASRAYNPAKSEIAPLLAMAKANIALNDAAAALESLNEAAMIDAENSETFLLRAYVNGNMLKNNKAETGDYQRAANGNAAQFPEIAYKAIAMYKAGNKEQADSYMKQSLADAGKTNNALLGAAIYYSQIGEITKASDFLAALKSRGYQNKYLMEIDKTPFLSIKNE